jgi:tetratricopeptide (TPR) repeat protein
MNLKPGILKLVVFLIFITGTFTFQQVVSGRTYYFLKFDQLKNQPDKTEEYKLHMTRGDKFFKEKNYSSAMFEYEKAADLMPNEEDPKLKMQAIEATLGTMELEEVRRKVALAKKQEKEAAEAEAAKAKAAKTAQTKAAPEKKSDFNDFLKDRKSQSKRDSIRRAIFELFADSVKRVEKGNDRVARSLVYTQIAEAFSDANDEEMALRYYQKALDIQEQVGYVNNITALHEGMANAYFVAGDFDKSVDSYEKSLDLKEKTGDHKGASDVMSNIANVYAATYDYQSAIQFYEKSATLKDSIKDKVGYKDVMDGLGNIYYKEKVLESSILSYEKSVKAIQELNMKDDLGPIYNKIGLAHYELGNFSDAEKFFEESMKNLQTAGNTKEEAMVLNNLGNLSYSNNKYRKAISYYEKSLDDKNQVDYQFGKAVTLYNLGNTYRQLGDFKKAIPYLEESKELSDKLNLNNLTAKNLKVLNIAYAETDQGNKAEQTKAKLDSLGLGYVSIEIPISENEMDLEVKKTQQVIAKLNEEALKRKDKIEIGADMKVTDLVIKNLKNRYKTEQTKNQQIIMISAIAGGVLLILLIVFIVMASRRKKKAATA